MRLGAAPDVPLFARAVLPLEWAAALEAADAAKVLIPAALWTADGPALEARHVGLLCPEEAQRVFAALWAALLTVSPALGYVDEGAWRVKLEIGARAHPSVASAMAESRDVVLGMHGPYWVDRPGRYYGMPPAELTDGQALAYRAACRVVDSVRRHHG